MTKEGTVLFYISVFGGILAVTRSLIPEENLVHDPENCLLKVIEDTHYMPESWRGNLHSYQVMIPKSYIILKKPRCGKNSTNSSSTKS